MKRDMVISARIPEEERDEFEAIAANDGRTPSSIIDRLIKKFNRCHRQSCLPGTEVMAARQLIGVLQEAIADGVIDPDERVLITRENSVFQFRLWKYGPKKAEKREQVGRAAK